MTQSKIDDAKRKYNEGQIKELLDKNGISGPPVLQYLNFARKFEGRKVKTHEDVEKVIKEYKENGLDEEKMREIMKLIPKPLRP